MGTPGRFDQRSTLGQTQQPLYNQLQGSANMGSFAPAADYYRSLLQDNNSTYQAMQAPEMRTFNEQILPGIASQFGSLGAGALGSSGYRNATLRAGTDLAERLASMRANLRQQGAAGLTGIGQQGLGQYFANMYTPRTPGFFENMAPAVGTAIGAGLTGGMGAAGTGISALLSYLSSRFGRGQNSLQDSISGNYAAGQGSPGAYYNPYTGIQQ